MSAIATVEKLPGEGEVQRIVRERVRVCCDECGEPAAYKHTFLLDNARRHPASSAYGKDDCSWCEDAHTFVCEEHKGLRHAPDGMSWCSTFTASPRFAGMFLEWKERKE